MEESSSEEEGGQQAEMNSAPESSSQATRGAQQRRKPEAKPTGQDALKPGICRRCGIQGSHPTATACIDALRDRLSRFE